MDEWVALGIVQRVSIIEKEVNIFRLHNAFFFLNILLFATWKRSEIYHNCFRHIREHSPAPTLVITTSFVAK